MSTNTFIFSGNSSDFTTYYPTTIGLNPKKKYEAPLLSIDLYNSFPNITAEITNSNIQQIVELLGKSLPSVQVHMNLKPSMTKSPPPPPDPPREPAISCR